MIEGFLHKNYDHIGVQPLKCEIFLIGVLTVFGVRPQWSLRRQFAPATSNNFKISEFPAAVATCKGVSPHELTESSSNGSANSIKYLRTLRELAAAVTCKQLFPDLD
jgi:hypothetical protein